MGLRRQQSRTLLEKDAAPTYAFWRLDTAIAVGRKWWTVDSRVSAATCCSCFCMARGMFRIATFQLEYQVVFVVRGPVFA